MFLRDEREYTYMVLQGRMEAACRACTPLTDDRAALLLKILTSRAGRMSLCVAASFLIQSIYEPFIQGVYRGLCCCPVPAAEDGGHPVTAQAHAHGAAGGNVVAHKG